MYDELETALKQCGSPASAAECHGILVGTLCAKNEADPTIWQKHIFPTSDDEQHSDEVYHLIAEISKELPQSLCEESFDFHLLLPDPGSPLDLRTQALSHWCQGFIIGVTEGGLQAFKHLPEDSTELISDFVKIARLSSSTPDETNENESDYVEIEEYVRTGVQLIYYELQLSTANTHQLH